MAGGQPVTGIPVIEFQSRGFAFSDYSGGRYSTNCVFTFSRPVVKAEAMLRSWNLHYNNREYVKDICVYCAAVTIQGNTVTVPVVLGMNDATGEYDDPYGGDAMVVVIAQLSQSL